jgi:putative FmdB family regulatory protein
MPTYEYRCETCGKEWEEVRKISERKDPCETPCPECKANGVVLKISKSAVVDPFAVRGHQNTSDFKDTLSRIHENNPGSQIDLDKYK